MPKFKVAIIGFIALTVAFLLLIMTAPKERSSEYLQAKLYLGGLDISNLSKAEALEKIYQQCSYIEEQGLNLVYEDKTIKLPSLTTSFDADLAYLLFYCDKVAISDALADYGQLNLLGRWQQNFFNRKATIVKPSFFVDETRIKDYIRSYLPELEKDAIDASFVFSDSGINISAEEPGLKIDWETTLSEIEQRLSYFSEADVKIYTRIEKPEIYQEDIVGLEEEAKQLSSKELTLKFNNQSWKINQADIASWLSVFKKGNKISLDFNESRVAQYLENKIAPKVNLLPQDHRFEIQDGKITNWQLGKNGYNLNIKDSAAKIVNLYHNEKTISEIDLAVDIINPAEADSFNIKEMVGTGHSNFAGSPANRRHNIKVGVEALHGLIIKPEEEFSLVKALGEIDASTGYLPELVIKGDKTIPEYGGGLCQVATTLFRGALASGLPITARQNHSYRVSYYEPAGTDASIYDPWPDVRFINDTGNDILIQANIENNDLYLEFWGTKDGRKIIISEPVIYNIVKPAPTKIIETTELKPGEKKCTERAHDGANAYFDYTVTYPENDEETGEEIEKYRRFNSYYVPWQEVCLVGKEEEIEAEEELATESQNSQDNLEQQEMPEDIVE
jgi:vancomycin resistance protein YoaR